MFRILRLVLGHLVRTFRSRKDRLLENLVLRQQLAMLKRHNRRRKVSVIDK